METLEISGREGLTFKRPTLMRPVREIPNDTLNNRLDAG